MRWQRSARLVIAIAAVAFAIVVVFAFKRRAPAPAAPLAVRTDPGAVVESTGGRIARFKLSREDVRVEYQKQLTYANGSTRLLGVTIISEDRGDGRTFTVSGKEGDVGQNESTITLNGDVKLTASDGMTVRTEHATYTDADGMVKGDGPVDFARGRMTGSGVGMTYDKNRDVVWILDRAAVHVAPEKGAGAAEITAGAAGFARRDKYIRFDRRVKMQRGGQMMEADGAVANLSADEKRIETIDLRGNSRLTAGKAGPGSLQALTGRDMDLKYAADGETLEHVVVEGDSVIQLAGDAGRSGRQIAAGTMDVTLAPDGTTPVGIVAREAVRLTLPADASTPTRTITAMAMDGKGEPGRGLTRAQFTGNVQFRERGAGTDRSANAATLDVALTPGMSSIEDARFAHGVRFVDGKMTATAAAARYHLDRGILELSGSEPGAAAPHVVNDQIAIDAMKIDVTLAGPKMKATGAVKSVLQPARNQTQTKLPSMLKQDQPVNVTADALDYDGAASKATYTGAAQLWQSDTTIKGASIALDDKTGDLSATGPVTTTTMLEETDKNKQKRRVRSIATSKAFKYEDAPRRATYTEDAHMSGPQGDLTAAKIELYLKPSGDELERAEAYDNVTLRDDQNRKTTGTRLTYMTADERYIVTGAPVTILECGRETIGKTLTYLKTADTFVVDGNEQTRTQTKGSGDCR